MSQAPDPRAQQPAGAQNSAQQEDEAASRRLEARLLGSGSQLLAMVDQRIRDFSNGLHSSARKGAQDIAVRLNAFVDYASFECDMDLSTDLQAEDRVFVPAHVAECLDALRKRRPAVYAELVQAARGVAGVDPVERREKIVEQAIRVAMLAERSA